MLPYFLLSGCYVLPVGCVIYLVAAGSHKFERKTIANQVCYSKLTFPEVPRYSPKCLERRFETCSLQFLPRNIILSCQHISNEVPIQPAIQFQSCADIFVHVHHIVYVTYKLYSHCAKYACNCVPKMMRVGVVLDIPRSLILKHHFSSLSKDAKVVLQ